MTLENGKYTVVRHSDGRVEALRYGQSWRDLTGDNLFALLLADAERYQWLREQSGSTVHIEESDDDGDMIFVCGHSPEQLDQAVDAALARIGGEA